MRIWLIPLLPAAGALINGVFGIRWFGRKLSGVLACAAIGGALALSVWAFADLIARPANTRVLESGLGQWIPAIPLATATGLGAFAVSWSFRLDPLSAVMTLVVTGIGFLIHVYSTAYMKDEPAGAFARFFAYLNLFCAFMLVLVLGGNFLVMFVGWEGVGLCSYLLIGFWYEKRSAADAGKKAFIMNRIGDAGFLLGVLLVFFTFGTLDFAEVAVAAAAMPREAAGFGVLSLICILLFVGATGKSAQIPLFVWLPDAMEGPTPVSALIHAATMVTAGVYMVARNAVLFERAPLVMQIVAIVGALTALIGATIALVQNDIKRVLAYSTISQVGYMFLATGVGAFAAAVFHLVTHAFFKALLFLGSGAVIHAVAGEQDMHRMGGLKQHMPVTFITMTLGALALAGVPPLSGFFSKDEILYRAFTGNRIIWAIASVTALLTALYISRLIALTFYGPFKGPPGSGAASADATVAAVLHGAAHPRDAHAHGQAQRREHEVTHGAADVHAHGAAPHEAPAAMTAPMIALAVGAIVSGFIGIRSGPGDASAIERFLEPSFRIGETADAAGIIAPLVPEETPGSAFAPSREPSVNRRAVSRGAELGLMGISVLIAVGGILAAGHVYLRRPAIPAYLAARWRGTHALIFNRFYVDELYDATAVRGTVASARALAAVDRRVIDTAVNAAGPITRIVSWLSHMADKHVVDGLVNLLGSSASRGSFSIRRVQTGLVQNYALMMVAGLFAFLTVYLLAR